MTVLHHRFRFSPQGLCTVGLLVPGDRVHLPRGLGRRGLDGGCGRSVLGGWECETGAGGGGGADQEEAQGHTPGRSTVTLHPIPEV